MDQSDVGSENCLETYEQGLKLFWCKNIVRSVTLPVFVNC